MSVREREKSTYEDAWGLEAYGEFSPGEQLVSVFLDMMGPGESMKRSILDAGCGSGKGALALHKAGFSNITCCDITKGGLVPEALTFPFLEVCLWEDLRKQHIPFVDWTYCTDVLEHIPTQFTMLVVSQLLRVTRRGVFLSIGLTQDSFGVLVGKPLHQTVQSFIWWRENLSALGKVVEARDLLNSGLFLLQPHAYHT